MRAAGKTWTGWIVIDVDASLVESHSDKEGAAGTYKKHIFGLHPIVVSCANTDEILAVLLREGNAGSVRHEVARVEWLHRWEVRPMSKV